MSKLTLSEILSNLEYESVFKNGIVLTGNIDYVSQHFGDYELESNNLSENQPKILKAFYESMKEYNNMNVESLSISDYFNKVWKNKGEK